MKAFKTFCREAKISISPWGVNFQFSVRDEKYVCLQKKSPQGELNLAYMHRVAPKNSQRFFRGFFRRFSSFHQPYCNFIFSNI